MSTEFSVILATLEKEDIELDMNGDLDFEKTFTRMVQADDYTLRHLVAHLNAAGEHGRVYQLLVQNRAWLEVKRRRFLSDEGFLEDIEIALANFSEYIGQAELPLFVGLFTARTAVIARSYRIDIIDLETLLWLGKERTAIYHVQFWEPKFRLNGYLTILRWQAEHNEINWELVHQASNFAEQQDPPERFNCLLEILLWEAEQKEIDWELVDSAFKFAEQQDPPERFNCLSQLALVLAEFQIPKSDKILARAIDEAHTILRERDKGDFDNLIGALIKREFMSEALFFWLNNNGIRLNQELLRWLIDKSQVEIAWDLALKPASDSLQDLTEATCIFLEAGYEDASTLVNNELESIRGKNVDSYGSRGLNDIFEVINHFALPDPLISERMRSFYLNTIDTALVIISSTSLNPKA